MADTENIQEFLKHYQIAEQLIAQKSKTDLAKCARLLAMTLAKYQIRYGVLARDISLEDDAEQHIHLEASEVLATGMKELVVALSLLADNEAASDPARIH